MSQSPSRRSADTGLSAQTQANTIENFKLVFDPRFMDTVIGRMDANEAIFKKNLDDTDLRDLLADFYLRKLYNRLRTWHIENAASGTPPARPSSLATLVTRMAVAVRQDAVGRSPGDRRSEAPS